MSASLLVVFDLDGTLVDSSAAIVETLDAALADHGYPSPPRRASIDLIGLPLGEMFPVLTRVDLEPRALDALIESYKARYPDAAARLEVAFPGVGALLADLAGAGARMAVATSKSTRGARTAVERHGLAAHLDLVLGFDAVPRPKPAPDMLVAAMDRLGFSADRTVMVGDTDYDMMMGRAAGVRTVGVTWGSHPSGRLRKGGAEVVVEAVEGLSDAIRRAWEWRSDT